MRSSFGKEVDIKVYRQVVAYHKMHFIKYQNTHLHLKITKYTPNQNLHTKFKNSQNTAIETYTYTARTYTSYTYTSHLDRKREPQNVQNSGSNQTHSEKTETF